MCLLTSIRFEAPGVLAILIGGVVVAALFLGGLALCAVLAVDDYEAGGRAKRDHE